PFTVVPRPAERGAPAPIDAFFRSLATGRAASAVGIVLSGSMSDGALGLKAIKAAGGLTFAQSEESASHPEMPRAAIACGAVDFILPPEEIALELTRAARHPYV